MHLQKYKTHNVPLNTAALLHTVMIRIWELKTCGAFQGTLMSWGRKKKSV